MTETPKYTVIRKDGNIELRQYAGYIQAEVGVTGETYKSAVERGFNILAGYIFGKNISKEKIAMTAPVQASQSQKIAMTAPVTVSGDAQYTVAFVMPSEYDLDSLPTPLDENIRFNRIPAHQMGVIRFSGFFKQSDIEKNKDRLRHWLRDAGLETEGDFIVAGYDPPWIPWFVARNEVMVRVRAGL